MIMLKNTAQPDRSQTTSQYGSCKLHAGLLKLLTYTRNMLHFLLFHGKYGYTNALPCLFVVYHASDSTDNMYLLFTSFHVDW